MDENLPTFNVLLVDDEQNIINALNRLFRRVGYQIFTANSGAEGLTILADNSIDLIISDMRMPHMDGAEFLAKASDAWPETMRLLLTGYSDINATIDAINKGKIYGYLSKPWNENELLLTVKQALEQKFLRDERKRLQDLTSRQNEELKDLNANLEKKVEERTKQLRVAHKRLKESYYAAIPVFASLARIREEGSANGHSKQVAEFARSLAERMKLEPNEIRDIFFAGLLHDIGKLSLPTSLLDKPQGKMTFPEREQYRKHVVTAESLLMGLEPLHNTAHIIRSHQELYNGKGFPDKLKAESIPLGSRILCIANDYCNLIRGHLLGSELSVADAIAYLKDSGRYDPYIVTEFIYFLEEQGKTDGSVRELRLNPDELQEGMILSRNLISSENMMLLAKDYVLREPMLSRIKAFAKNEGEHFVIHIDAERMASLDEEN